MYFNKYLEKRNEIHKEISCIEDFVQCLIACKYLNLYLVHSHSSLIYMVLAFEWNLILNEILYY